LEKCDYETLIQIYVDNTTHGFVLIPPSQAPFTELCEGVA